MEWPEWVTKRAGRGRRGTEARSWIVPLPPKPFQGKESWESGPELLFGWIEPILLPENWDLGLQPLDFSALSGPGCLFLCSRVKIRPGATSPLPGSPTK